MCKGNTGNAGMTREQLKELYLQKCDRDTEKALDLAMKVILIISAPEPGFERGYDPMTGKPNE